MNKEAQDFTLRLRPTVEGWHQGGVVWSKHWNAGVGVHSLEIIQKQRVPSTTDLD